MTDGFRESTQSWREVLLGLKRRGLMSDNQVGLYRQPSWPLPAAGGRA